MGRNDCAHLAAAMLDLAAIDHPVPKATDYKTPQGARRALKRAGFNSVVEALDATLGDPLETPLFAKPGDILALPGTNDAGEMEFDPIMPVLAVMLTDGRAICFAGGTCVLGWASPARMAWGLRYA